jgi:hypothetical protein
MYWPIVGFAIGFLIVSGFLAAAGFHVFRYHYRNDASIPVFVLACLLFFIITIFVFSEFDWERVLPVSINNTL